MKEKHAVAVIENGNLVFLAKPRTSDGIEKTCAEIRILDMKARIRLLREGTWMGCDE